MIAAIGGIFSPILAAAVLYGRFTEKTRQNTLEIFTLRQEHGEKLAEHDVKIGELEIQSAKSAGWQEGFQVGRAKVAQS
jgi:hypothetical protein